jgi:hypothetical protein
LFHLTTTTSTYNYYTGKCHLSELQVNGKHSVGIDKRRGDRYESDDDDIDNNNDDDDDGNIIGKIVLSRSPDGLLHFKWINLINNATEGNVIDVDVGADECR